MKNKITLPSLLIWLLSPNTNAQTVPTLFCGENAWMPDSVGNWHISGNLETNWTNVNQSNVKTIRYGGHAVDSLKPTFTQYIKIIDSLRAKGIEPAITVPVYPNPSYDSLMAHNIITYINITKAKKIKYWIIGNEPDRYPAGFNTARNIYKYITQYAIAMKRVDSSIKIIALN